MTLTPLHPPLLPSSGPLTCIAPSNAAEPRNMQDEDEWIWKRESEVEECGTIEGEVRWTRNK